MKRKKEVETFQQLYIEAKKLFEKYETSHQRDMQIIKKLQQTALNTNSRLIDYH